MGAIVRYFEDDADTLRILVFTGGQETALFSEDETLHMEDVKGLMRTIFRANEVALGFVLAYVGTVLWAGEGALVGVAVGIVALVGFDGAWNQLHEILFTNDLWLLDPRTDRLIQMFPETFWAEATFIVVGMALVEAVVLVGAAGGYLWFTRPPRAEQDEPEEETADSDVSAEDEGEDEAPDSDSDEGEEEEETAASGETAGDEEERQEAPESEGDSQEGSSEDEEPSEEAEPEEVEGSAGDEEEPEESGGAAAATAAAGAATGRTELRLHLSDGGVTASHRDGEVGDGALGAMAGLALRRSGSLRHGAATFEGVAAGGAVVLVDRHVGSIAASVIRRR